MVQHLRTPNLFDDTNHFSENVRQALKYSKNFSPYFELRTFLLKCAKSLNHIFWVKFGSPRQNHFCGKEKKTLKLFKTLLATLELTKKLFWNLNRPYYKSSESLNIGTQLKKASLSWCIQNPFSNNKRRPLHFSIFFSWYWS